jgi:hypothetical protein
VPWARTARTSHRTAILSWTRFLDSATATFDPARTRDYARRAFETIIEDAAGIWLYEPPMVAGVHKRIHTTTMRADGYWSGMADWWIPAAERTARDRIGLRPDAVGRATLRRRPAAAGDDRRAPRHDGHLRARSTSRRVIRSRCC